MVDRPWREDACNYLFSQYIETVSSSAPSSLSSAKWWSGFSARAGMPGCLLDALRVYPLHLVLNRDLLDHHARLLRTSVPRQAAVPLILSGHSFASLCAGSGSALVLPADIEREPKISTAKTESSRIYTPSMRAALQLSPAPSRAPRTRLLPIALACRP